MTQTPAARAPALRPRALLYPDSQADSAWGKRARQVRGKSFRFLLSGDDKAAR